MQTRRPDAAQLFGYDVLDSEGNKIGSVDNVWVDDATNDLEFIGVKTGFLLGKTHVIPTADAQFGDNAVTVPFPQDQVKDAPSFSGDEELSAEQEDQIYSYYGLQRSTSTSPTGEAATGTTTSRDMGAATDTTAQTDTGYATEGGYADSRYAGRNTGYTGTDTGTSDTDQNLTLSEEQLQVGKREVEAGRVRLRKVVRTEHQEVPVDLRREQVSVERVDTSGTEVPSDAFQEREVEVPVRREEPVVGKEAQVTGQVGINRDVRTETRTVGGDVRREDVDVDRDTTDTATDDETSYRS